MVFGVVNTSDRVSLDVMCEEARKKPAKTSAFFRPPTLQPLFRPSCLFAKVDLQIPLRTASLKILPFGTGGALHVVIATRRTISPLDVSRLSLVLNRTRMQLDRQVYYPGETVRGVLIVSRSEEREIFSSLSLVGFSRVSWLSSVGAQFERSCYIHYESCCVNGRLEDRGRGVWKETGGGVVSFAYTLPLNLPASIRLSSGNYIKYFMALCVEERGRKKRIELPFIVLAHPLSFPLNSFLSSLPFISDKFSQDFDIEMVVHAPQTLHLKELNFLSLSLSSSSLRCDLMVDYISVRLHCIVSRQGNCCGTWQCAETKGISCSWSIAPSSSSRRSHFSDSDANWSHTINSKETFWRLEWKKHNDRRRGGDLHSDFWLPLGEICPPSTGPWVSPLLQIEYFLTVKAKRYGRTHDTTLANVDFPIFVSSPRPRLTPPSSSPATCPKQRIPHWMTPDTLLHTYQTHFLQRSLHRSFRLAPASSTTEHCFREYAVPPTTSDGRTLPSFHSARAQRRPFPIRTIPGTYKPNRSSQVHAMDVKHAHTNLPHEHWRPGNVPYFIDDHYESPLLLTYPAAHLHAFTIEALPSSASSSSSLLPEAEKLPL